MDQEQLLKTVIDAFLKANPDPSDDQFHALAAALGVDHEYLESISYAMLAEADSTAVGQPRIAAVDVDTGGAGDIGLSKEQEVMNGDYDPLTTSPDDLMLNDGTPEGTSTTQENKDATYDDGAGHDDMGVDVAGDQDALLDDGFAPVTLAAVRLRTLAKLKR